MIIDKWFQNLFGLKSSDDSELIIDNILFGSSVYRMTGQEKVFSDIDYCFVIIENGCYGFSYHGKNENTDTFSKFVNISAYEAYQLCDFVPLKTAILDAIAQYWLKKNDIEPSKLVILRGNYSEKALMRASEITSHLKKNEKVVLVGAVSEIIYKLNEITENLVVTDLSCEKTERIIGKSKVQNSNNSIIESIRQADVVIVTGSTISNNTVENIIKIANESNTRIFFYLETGAHLSQQLIKMGADIIFSETFPFYDMPGETTFEVYFNDKKSYY